MGVKVIGLEAPIIREHDNIGDMVVKALKDIEIHDKDVLGITESVVARAQGNYVTVDDIVQFLEEKHIMKKIYLDSPIMSRNRFSIILKAFARYADEISIILDGMYDEQGNPNYGENHFTKVNIQNYYKEICEEENCKLNFLNENFYVHFVINENESYIDCRCHPGNTGEYITLKDIMNLPVTRKNGSKSGYNEKYGLLGSNKADEELLKLFPRDGNDFCNDVKWKIKLSYNVDVEVMIYGDGCFKDPVGGIWEFADPVTCPGCSKGLDYWGTPNEIKVKYFADSKYKHLSGKELEEAIDKEIEQHKNKDLVGSMDSQGTTPRRYVDLLASLMDLTSGSGMRKTPFVLVQNYFD